MLVDRGPRHAIQREGAARLDHRPGEGNGLVPIQSPDEGSHEESGGQLVRHVPPGVPEDHGAKLVLRQRVAISFPGHDVPGIRHHTPNSGPKLVPASPSPPRTPNSDATVAPSSANVSRIPRSTASCPPRAPPATSTGVCSRV